MKKFLYPILSVIILLAWNSCQSQVGPLPIETIRYDEASGFTVITDTVKLDLVRLGIDASGPDSIYGYDPFNFSIVSVLRQRGQYKMMYAVDEIVPQQKWQDLSPFYLTTFNKDLVSLYDRSDLIPIDLDEDYVQFHEYNDSLYLPLNFDTSEQESPVAKRLFNLDSGSSVIIDQYKKLCYQDDFCRVEYLDGGEFGQYLFFSSLDSSQSNCLRLPMTRLLRWHGIYYCIAASDIFLIENPFEEGPKRTREYWPKVTYSLAENNPIQGLSLNNSWLCNAYMGYTQKDTVYLTGFIRNDELFVVESRPQDGIFLMQIEEPNKKKEILRICDFIPIDERFNTRYTNLNAPSYSILQMMGCNDKGVVQNRGFIEFNSDTIRIVFFYFQMSINVFSNIDEAEC